MKENGFSVALAGMSFKALSMCAWYLLSAVVCMCALLCHLCVCLHALITFH